MAGRKYELKKRAEKQDETRRRIAMATLELHMQVGPAATTISGIAERAGVQRLTVYRHFPDELSLYNACGDLWMAFAPLPDPAAWAAIADPGERLRTALEAFYPYYRAAEITLTHILRDAEHMPVFVQALKPRFTDPLERARQVLAEGWHGDPVLVRAAVGHALDFWAWRSLAHQGLDDAAIASLMLAMLRCGTAPTPASPRSEPS
jgi:AcrR family transcriptional regulator